MFGFADCPCSATLRFQTQTTQEIHQFKKIGYLLMNRTKTYQFFPSNGISNAFYALLPPLVCGEFLHENGAPSNEKLDNSKKETKGGNTGET